MKPLATNIRRYFSLKEIMVVVLAIMFSISAGVGIFFYLKKEVVINDNGKTLAVKTMKNSVKEVLDQNGVSVGKYDYINPALDEKLQRTNKTEIYIRRAVPVYVTADGKETTLMTCKDTVGEALKESSIKLGAHDKLVGAALSDKIVGSMTLKVVRINENVVKEEHTVPFRTISRSNDNLDKGSQKTVREGKEGVREKSFKVVYEDGKEVARELVSDVIVKNPTDKVVEFGTVMNFKTSRGDTVRYEKALNMRATAYTASYADTGKHPGDAGFGITYTGMRVRKGVIAVDPKVIPLGTRVYIEVAGSTPDYGYAVAADIGSAIKGNLIDLYFDSSTTVRNWGCKKVKVYILKD